MASELGDDFDGGSPLFVSDDEGYDDTNGTQSLVNGLDIPMPDFEDDGPLLPTPAHSPAFDTNIDSVRLGRNEMTPVCADPPRGQTLGSDQIRSLLTSSMNGDEASPAQPNVSQSPEGPTQSRANSDVPIKRETSDFEILWERFKPAEVIDIADSDEESNDKPIRSPYRYGNSLADGTIEISDGEDDHGNDDQEVYKVAGTSSVAIKKEDSDKEVVILYEDGSTSVATKTKNADVEFLGATKNPVEQPEDSSSEDEPQITSVPKLGKSLLQTSIQRSQRPPADLEKLKRMQKLYADKHRIAIGPEGMSKAPPSAGISGPPGLGNAPRDNGFSWMSDTVLLDQNETDFQALKQSYKAKRKSRKNTVEDDIEYKKAQTKENNRLRRLALETADSGSSEDEAEESDDGRFVSERRPRTSTKPLFSGSNDDDELDDADLALTKMLTGKSGPKKTKTKASSPSSKAELSTKRSRARDLEKELRSNMMAGIEAIVLRDQKRLEEAAVRQAEAEEIARGGKASKKRKGTKPVNNVTKRTKTGRMNNFDSLGTSNIYEDSNANLDKPALPLVADKKKKDFMTSLIANVPLADKKQANQDRIDIVRASKILGSYKVVPDGKGNWAFKGMLSSLYHYQVQGAAHMKSREIGEQAPYGGILADEMGLGKTVQMIATIIANPQLDPNLPKSTLVVCSPALIGQWEKELKKHVKVGVLRRISRHHSNTRYSGTGAAEDMENANVILTTYGEVIRSYPNCDLPKELKTPAEKEEWWVKYWDEKRDLLHRAQFYRVVLDEAQAIKNHNSQTSIACRALMAKHRWAISGTPIQNRLEELFPYFKFLRVKHTGSLGIFRHNFCLKDSDVCNKRLHSMLDGMMIRRTHTDTVLGAPLYKLPKNTQETIRLKFNKVERNVYDMIRMRCVRYINAVAKDGTLEEKTKAVIVMFQRLRQMVSHIFMVQELLEKEIENVEVEAMWKHIIGNANHTDSEESMMRGLKRMIAEKKDEHEEGRGTGMVFTSPKARQETTKSKKPAPLVVRLDKFLKDLKKRAKWSELRERSLCNACGQPPENAFVTSCLHVYCEECLNNMAYDASNLDLDSTPCGKCGEVYTESVSCGDLKALQIRDLSASVFQEDKDETVTKKPFKLTMDYVDHKDNVLLSTKCAAVKAQLAKWIEEDPKCKIIVFSEWLMVMHILGRVCQLEGWKNCHYNGKMSHSARDQSLSTFQDTESDVQVLIASLKCGGTGLNLTAASKVICVDLWFNSCVEQQAFARVHRIGQDHETYITRYVIEGTVDERLIEMQEEKKEIISAAMDDRSIMAQLTLTELLKLFGPVAYDENSTPFIMVDDDAERSYRSVR